MRSYAFYKENSRYLFCGKFIENVFCYIIFPLKIRYFHRKMQKTASWMIQAPREQLLEVVGGGRVSWVIRGSLSTVSRNETKYGNSVFHNPNVLLTTDERSFFKNEICKFAR